MIRFAFALVSYMMIMLLRQLPRGVRLQLICQVYTWCHWRGQGSRHWSWEMCRQWWYNGGRKVA